MPQVVPGVALLCPVCPRGASLRVNPRGNRRCLAKTWSHDRQPHEVKDMERTMFDYFHRTVDRFPDKDFQRIKKGKSFYGVTYQQAYQKVL